MRSRLSIVLFILVGFVVGGGVTALAALQHQREGGEGRGARKSQQMIEAESRLPVTDYDAPKETDPKKQQARIARGEKYEKSDLIIDSSADVVTSTTHWAAGLSAIPADNCDAIVVGNVSSAGAYTTPSKTRVYSEFTVQINEAIKDGGDNSIQVGGSVDVDRIGGRVQFSNVRIGQYFITGQGMPQVGKQYLLFLTKSAGKGNYSILTGYEIRDGQVYLLDSPGSGHPITVRRGTDAASFLNEVRVAVSSP